MDAIKKHTAYSVDFTVARGTTGAIEHVQVLPDIAPSGKGKIGVALRNNAETKLQQADGPVELLTQAGKETWRLLSETTKSLVSLLSNFGEQKENLSGPVGVVAALSLIHI